MPSQAPMELDLFHNSQTNEIQTNETRVTNKQNAIQTNETRFTNVFHDSQMYFVIHK